MAYIAAIFAGAFLCNAIPHVVAGLQGVPFPSPFATPRGIGDSSPFVNFLWGAFNLAVGAGLLTAYPIAIGFTPEFLLFVAGALAIGTHLSLHFGKVQAEKRAK